LTEFLLVKVEFCLLLSKCYKSMMDILMGCCCYSCCFVASDGWGDWLQEVEADRKAAEDSGCAVNLKSNQQSPADHAEIQSEVRHLTLYTVFSRQ